VSSPDGAPFRGVRRHAAAFLHGVSNGAPPSPRIFSGDPRLWSLRRDRSCNFRTESSGKIMLKSQCPEPGGARYSAASSCGAAGRQRSTG
jgi:hypothetical protein